MNFEFTDLNGRKGVCDVERHSDLIVVTELDENTAMSVTNACTFIATQYCKQNGIRPWDLFFFERYDERSGEAYAGDNTACASVKMNVDMNRTFYSPVWIRYNKEAFDAVVNNYKNREILEKLYEDQMISSGPCPRCGKNRAGTTTALSRRAKVMICNQCGTEEAMMDATREYPMLFSNWAYIRVLNGKQPFVTSITEGE